MEIHEWLPTKLGRDILTQKYLQPGETLDQFFDRVSGGDPKVRKLIVEKRFLPAGRILSNRGVDRKGSLSNCYVITPPEDNIESIWECSMKMARTYSYGGGCGTDLGKIAPAGAAVDNEARQSSGSASFMKLYSVTTELIGQNGRRGALMLSMPVSHPDIEKFIHAKEKNGDLSTANISVRVSDDFMRAVEADADWHTSFTRPETGDTVEHTFRARDLFHQIAENAWDNGEPGVLFWDAVKRRSYLEYDPEFEFAGTNPCLTGDTLIQTVDGEIPIRELVGKKPYVYSMDSGGKLVIARAERVWKTRENAQLVEVVTSRGSLRCTPDHLIHTRNRGWVAAADLKRGDKVTGLNRSMKDEIHVAVALSGTKKYVPEHRFIMAAFQDISGKDVHHIDNDTLHNVRSNLEVLEHSDHSRISNTGRKIEVVRNGKGQYVRKEQKAPVYSINQGKGTGTNWFVQSVTWLENKEDVYDMTVPETHNFVANRIVVHNCGEEPLPAGGSCLLGSMNLAAYVLRPFRPDAAFDFDAFSEDVRIAVEELNRILDEGRGKHPLREQRESVTKWRQIGLGVMGLGDALAMLNLQYGSGGAVDECAHIAKILRGSALLESVALGKRDGSYPAFKEEAINGSRMIPQTVYISALRNSQILTCAPTGSISTMLGISGGIEPIFSVEGFSRKTESLHGETVVYDDNTSYSVRLWEEMYPGVDLPDCFVGAHEIPWEQRLRTQSAWQRYIDAAISSTVNLPHDATVEDVEALYMRAWRLGLKGVTVFRDGCRRAGVLTEGKAEQTDGTAAKELARGEIADVPEGLTYQKHKLHTGCGTLYLFVGVDEDGNVHDVYTNASGDGGCPVNTVAVSRSISMQLRAGVPIEKIAEQMDKAGVCPSYQRARGAKKPISSGKSCPSSIGRVLLEYARAAKKPTVQPTEAAGAKIAPEVKQPSGGQKRCEAGRAGGCAAVGGSDALQMRRPLYGGRPCPECGAEMMEQGGCPVCPNCGYSRCG